MSFGDEIKKIMKQTFLSRSIVELNKTPLKRKAPH